MATTLVRSAGTSTLVIPPKPIYRHFTTVPSAFNTRPASYPAETATALLHGPENWFVPQLNTVPSVVKAEANCQPPTTATRFEFVGIAAKPQQSLPPTTTLPS